MTIVSENITTTPVENPTPERLSQFFIDGFPAMDTDEQRLALGLYALLVKGQAVTIAELAEHIGLPVGKVKFDLNNWPGVFYDDQNRVVGFWGIAVTEMHHRFDVNGHTAYTWCAWDALFIPELINTTANITSHCATTGEEIKLSISPEGVIAALSEQIMVSFLIPHKNKLNENTTTDFCQYVHFFNSLEAGEKWIANHKGTFLLSLNDAFTVGKLMNAVRYKQTLDTLKGH